MPAISSVAAMRMATPIAVSRMTIGCVVWPVAMTATVAMSGRTRTESCSKNPANRIPAVAVSAGIDHCRYRTNLVARSVGPGIVLTTARAARSAPIARGHERPGTRTLAGAAFAR